MYYNFVQWCFLFWKKLLESPGVQFLSILHSSKIVIFYVCHWNGDGDLHGDGFPARGRGRGKLKPRRWSRGRGWRHICPHGDGDGEPSSDGEFPVAIFSAAGTGESLSKQVSVRTRFAVPAPTLPLGTFTHHPTAICNSVSFHFQSSFAPDPPFISTRISRAAPAPAPAPMDLPVVDLAPYLRAAAGDAAPAGEEELRTLCATVSASLRDTGALLVMDPRCSAADNDRFLDVVERYFARSADAKRLQERPHLYYQVGSCPPRTFSSLSVLSNWAIGFDGSGVGMVNRMALNTGFTVLGLIPPRLDPDHCRD